MFRSGLRSVLGRFFTPAMRRISGSSRIILRPTRLVLDSDRIPLGLKSIVLRLSLGSINLVLRLTNVLGTALLS